MIDDPTDEERAEAEALRRYLDGEAAPPSAELGATVGLLREAAGSGPVSAGGPGSKAPGPAPVDGLREARRRERRRTTIWPYAAPALAIAAMLMMVFIPPAAPALPAGPSPEQLGNAVRVMAAPAPLPERLEALHEVAAAERARVVAILRSAPTDRAAAGLSGLVLAEKLRLPARATVPRPDAGVR